MNNDHSQLHNVDLPYSENFHGCVMFADISGFTTIVEEMSLLGSEGIERMTASLNAFFGILVETVEQHGGDVIKFAGDALFCQVIENRNNFN